MVWGLVYDTEDCVWTQFLSQMLLKALLPAPGAEYNSYLKNAYKKSQLFFSHLWKNQTNDNNKKKKNWKSKQPAVNEVMKIKKNEVKAEVWWSNQAILVLFPFLCC